MADAVAPRPARRAKPARSALCDRSNGTGEEQLASAAQQVQPADDAMTTAEHAARLSLPRISAENAAQHPPLSTKPPRFPQGLSQSAGQFGAGALVLADDG